MTAPACGRIGCDSTATSVLLIAPQDCEAWIVGLDHPAAPEGVKLCEVHADRITVPFGWSLSNERSTTKKRRRRKPRTTTEVAPPPAKPTTRRAATPAGEAKKAEPAPVEPVAEAAPIDPPTMQLPAVTVDDEPAPPSRPAPADVPVRADHVAEAIDEAEDPRHLQVVAEREAAGARAEETQPSFWDDAEHEGQLEPSDRTPMLKRAFRVVRDD